MLAELELLDDASAPKFAAEVWPMFSFKGLSVVLVAALTIAGVVGEVAAKDTGDASGSATRLELRDSPQLRKLAGYAGTPIFIKTMDLHFVVAGPHADRESSEYSASEHLAQTFSRLQTDAHWKYRGAQPGFVHDGITLLSWTDRPTKPAGREYRAYEAAQALRCVLYQQLGVWPVYWKATTLPEYPALPKNGVLVESAGSCRKIKFRRNTAIINSKNVPLKWTWEPRDKHREPRRSRSAYSGADAVSDSIFSSSAYIRSISRSSC
jgi:hypothetical protein